jgi:hypothetical protein
MRTGVGAARSTARSVVGAASCSGAGMPVTSLLRKPPRWPGAGPARLVEGMSGSGLERLRPGSRSRRAITRRRFGSRRRAGRRRLVTARRDRGSPPPRVARQRALVGEPAPMRVYDTPSRRETKQPGACGAMARATCDRRGVSRLMPRCRSALAQDGRGDVEGPERLLTGPATRSAGSAVPATGRCAVARDRALLALLMADVRTLSRRSTGRGITDEICRTMIVGRSRWGCRLTSDRRERAGPISRGVRSSGMTAAVAGEVRGTSAWRCAPARAVAGTVDRHSCGRQQARRLG